MKRTTQTTTPWRLCRLRRVLPYLDLWLDIGLLQIQTELLTERYEEFSRVYIGMRITVLKRWGWRFRLYSPMG